MMSIHDGHFTCSTRKDVSINVQKTILPKNIVINALTMKDVINPLGGTLGKSEKQYPDTKSCK